MDHSQNPKMGINHTLFLFNLKFVLQKNEKGYKGYFTKANSGNVPTPLFQGYTFRQALGRLVHKAARLGYVSIEEHNKFIGMEWKTPLDIEVWSKMNKLTKQDGKHYYISYIPQVFNEDDE